SGAKLQSGSGITIHSDCDAPDQFTMHTITGLNLHHFPGNGIDVSGIRTNAQILDSTLTDNMRGVLVDVDTAFVGVAGSLVSRNARDGVEVANGLVTLSQNQIRANRGNGVQIRNGGGALTIQNIVTRNGRSGYALGEGSTLQPFISDSIYANGVLAIDHEGDAPAAPVIIAALYDRNANVTRVRGTVDTPAVPEGEVLLHVFSNGGYNASGHAEAEHDETLVAPIRIEAPEEGTHSWSTTIPGDQRGRIITAIAGIAPFGFFPQNVSEVSEGVPVR